MWIVVSSNNINLFKSEVKKKFSDIKFYYPKIKSEKKGTIKNLLGNYLFCYSEEFSKNNNLNSLKFTKGLKKILFCNQLFYNEIINFIDHCKSHEDKNGHIKNSFFKIGIKEKGKFLNGPFTNYIFNLVQKEKKYIKVLVGEIKISISDTGSFNYSTI